MGVQETNPSPRINNFQMSTLVELKNSTKG
jgi:hypothetical protein